MRIVQNCACVLVASRATLASLACREEQLVFAEKQLYFFLLLLCAIAGFLGCCFYGLGGIYGDGYDDVLVSAPLGEDPDGGAALSSQGVVYGLRGGPDGLAESPDQVFAGHRAGLQLGRDIVTGDVDGDGRCDVVASAYDSATNAVDAGSAYLWLGASGVGSAVPDATIDHDEGVPDVAARDAERAGLTRDARSDEKIVKYGSMFRARVASTA